MNVKEIISQRLNDALKIDHNHAQSVKHLSEMIGTVLATEEHGNVKVVGFEEKEDWGGKVIIYLGAPSLTTVIGSLTVPNPRLEGGALIVEKTEEPVTSGN